MHVTEDGKRSVINYAVLGNAPGSPKNQRERIIWAIRQSLSGSRVAASDKIAVVVRSSALEIQLTFPDAILG